MILKNKTVRFLFTIIVGLLVGYVLLHPLSVFIVFLFERKIFDFLLILRESFSYIHLLMGVYFALIGGLIGVIFAVFHYRSVKTNTTIMEINYQLQDQNKQLLKKIKNKGNNSPVLDDLWLTANKVHKGVDLIASGGMGDITHRQSALLEITKENIENLFTIIDKNLNLRNKGVRGDIKNLDP